MDGGVERAAVQSRNVVGAAAGSGIAGAMAGSDKGADPYAGMNISRNAPCPCGSALKYKQCHGKI